MKFTWSFKCWAVMLSYCLVAIPLYAQVQDTVHQKQVQSVQQTSPVQPANSPAAQQVQPAQQYPPAQQYSPATQPPPSQPPAVTSGIQPSPNVSNYDEFLRGKMDGKRDAKGNPLWIFAGLTGVCITIFIGVAGIGLALIVAPSPPEQMLLGKSTLYIQGYTEGYKSKGRWKNAGWATVGCVTAGLINIIVNVASGKVPAN